MPAKRKPHKTNRTDRTGDGSAPYDTTGTTGDGSAPYDRTGTTGDGSAPYPLFYRPLSRLRMRMHINRAIHILVYAGLIFSGAFFALSLSAVIIPVPFFWNKAMLGFVLVFGLTLLSVPFISPRRLTVIKTADSLGLKERVITAFLLQDSDSPVAKLQRLDTLETLSNTDFRKLYRLKFPVREVALSVALLLLATALFMVPSEARYKASVLENVTNEIRKQADIIKEEKEKIAQKSESGDEMLSKMEEELNKLLDTLKKANSEEDALKELSKTSHKIEDIAKENSERMAALSSKLIEKPMTQRLGEALSKGADDDFEKELEDLLKKLDGMNPEEAKELAEQFEDVASALGEGMPLAQNLEELAAALASGDMTRAAGAVSKASSLIAMAMRNTGSDEIQNIMGAIGEAGRRISSAAGNENRFNRMALAGSRAFPGEVPNDGTTGGGGSAPGNEGKGGENGGNSGSNAGARNPGGNQGSGQGSGQEATREAETAPGMALQTWHPVISRKARGRRERTGKNHW